MAVPSIPRTSNHSRWLPRKALSQNGFRQPQCLAHRHMLVIWWIISGIIGRLCTIPQPVIDIPCILWMLLMCAGLTTAIFLFLRATPFDELVARFDGRASARIGRIWFSLFVPAWLLTCSALPDETGRSCTIGFRMAQEDPTPVDAAIKKRNRLTARPPNKYAWAFLPVAVTRRRARRTSAWTGLRGP